MSHIARIALAGLTGLLLVQPVLAQDAADRRFAIRFGLIALEPTGDSDLGGGNKAELDSSFGAEFDFEWYFAKRVGLEASIATAASSDLDSDDDMFRLSGISTTPLTVGINGHLIRSSAIDWYIGVVAGAVSYTDFDIEGGGGSSSGQSNEIDTSPTWGAQTAVDFNIGSRWGVNVGIKYLDSAIEFDEPGQADVDVNPLIVRAMGVFRF